MSRVYVISDTHFGHKRITAPDARNFSSVEAHDQELVARWNAIVRKRDTVWHLGDVFFGTHAHAILGELKGHKRLILGNHDTYPLAVYQQYFSHIYGAAEFRGCILTHIPVHESSLYRYAKNIHGHMHQKSIPDSRYACVSAEQYGLAPVLMDTVIGGATRPNHGKSGHETDEEIS
jgi:calcineurin-like phosphoesterase family protein